MASVRSDQGTIPIPVINDCWERSRGTAFLSSVGKATIQISLLAVMFAFNHFGPSGSAMGSCCCIAVSWTTGGVGGPEYVGDEDLPKNEAIGDVGRPLPLVGELPLPALLSHPPSQFDVPRSPSGPSMRVPTSVASTLCHTAPAGVRLNGAIWDGRTRLNSNLRSVSAGQV